MITNDDEQMAACKRTRRYTGKGIDRSVTASCPKCGWVTPQVFLNKGSAAEVIVTLKALKCLQSHK